MQLNASLVSDGVRPSLAAALATLWLKSIWEEGGAALMGDIASRLTQLEVAASKGKQKADAKPEATALQAQLSNYLHLPPNSAPSDAAPGGPDPDVSSDAESAANAVNAVAADPEMDGAAS